MGYRRKSTVFKLKFEDPEFEGLEVLARKPSMGSLLDMAKMKDLINTKPADMTDEQLDDLRSMFKFFADFLESWNLEDEKGVPVPHTADGLLSQDPEFVMSIISGWSEAISSISLPLGRQSDDGLQFPVDSIPMETLSANLLS